MIFAKRNYFVHLQKKSKSISLDSGKDYRRSAKSDSDVYFVKGQVDADNECDRVFKQLAAAENDSMSDSF